MSEDLIEVAVRLRPKINREIQKQLPSYWAVQGTEIVQLDETGARTSNDSYIFDYAFDTDQTNQDVYNIVKRIVHCATEGINGTIFAYGQTSSGKTHSIMGSREDPGIIPRAIDDIFSMVERDACRKYLIRASYLEIYNEKINDLLNKSLRDLKIREDVMGNLLVAQCTEEITTTRKELLNLVIKGNKIKQLGETNMNELSSRSHVILKVIIESSELNSNVDDLPVHVSNLYIVDLAGSERVSQTKSTGVRFKEGTQINKSLSVLSLVIKQLSENQEHISFRDSKLTRILSNALGGNSKTMIIATITPVSIEDTQSTLQFANCARNIKNKPHVNEIVTEAALIKRHRQKEKTLVHELKLEKEKNITLQKDQNLKDQRIASLEEQLMMIRKDFVISIPRTISKLPIRRRHTLAYPPRTLENIHEENEKNVQEDEVTEDAPCEHDRLRSIDDESPPEFIGKVDNSSSPSKEVLKERLELLNISHLELQEFFNAELTVEVQEKSEHLQSELQQSKAAVEEKEAENLNLQQEIQRLQQDMRLKNQTCAELETSNEFFKSRFNKREVELLALIEEKDTHIKQLAEIHVKTAMAKEISNYDELKRRADELDIQVVKLDEDLRTSNVRCQEIEVKKSKLEGNLATLEKKYQVALSNISVDKSWKLRRVHSDSSMLDLKNFLAQETTACILGSSTDLLGQIKEDIYSLQTIITSHTVDEGMSKVCEIASDKDNVYASSSTCTTINLFDDIPTDVKELQKVFAETRDELSDISLKYNLLIHQEDHEKDELRKVLAETRDELAGISLKYNDLLKDQKVYREDCEKEMNNIRLKSQNELAYSTTKLAALDAVYAAKAEDLVKACNENHISSIEHESILLACKQEYETKLTELKLANEKNIQNEQTRFAEEMEELKEFYDNEAMIKNVTVDEVEKKFLTLQDNYQILLTSKVALQLEYNNKETEINEMSTKLNEILTAQNATATSLELQADHELLKKNYDEMIENLVVCQSTANRKQEELDEAYRKIDHLTNEKDQLEEQSKKIIADIMMKSTEAEKQSAMEIKNMRELLDKLENNYIEKDYQIKSSYEERVIEISKGKESVMSLNSDLHKSKESKEQELHEANLQGEIKTLKVEMLTKSSDTKKETLNEINELKKSLADLKDNHASKISQMEHLYKQKTEELVKIQFDLVNKNNTLQNISAELEEANSKVEALDTETNNLQAEVARLRENSNVLDHENDLYKHSIQELEKIESDLVKENLILQHSKTEELQEANSRIEALTTQIKNLQVQVETNSDNLSQVKASYEQKIEELTHSNDLSQMKLSYEWKVEELLKKQADLDRINKELHECMLSARTGDYVWEEQIHSLTNTITMQKKDILAHQDRIDELETIVQDRNKQNKKLSLELNGKNKITADNAEELIKITEELCEKNKKLEECSKEVINLTAMLTEKKKVIEDKTEQFKKLTVVLCEANSKIKDQAAELTKIQKLIDKNKDIQDNTKELKKVTAELFEANKKIEDQAAELVKVLENNQCIANNLKLSEHELTASRKIINDMSIKHGFEESAFKRELKTMEDNLKIRALELLETQRSLTNLERSIKELESDLNNKVITIEQLSQEIVTLKDTNTKLNEKFEKQHSGFIQQATITDNDNFIESLKTNPQESASKVEECEDVSIIEQKPSDREIKRRSDPFRVRRSIAQDAGRHLDDIDIDCEECLTLKQEKRGLEAIIKEKEAENKSLDDEVEGCAEELEKLRKNLRSLREKNTSLQTALNLQEAANKTLEERIADCEGCLTLKQEKHGLEAIIKEKEAENKSLDDEVKGCAEELEKLRKILRSLRAKNTSLQTADKTLEERIADCEGCLTLKQEKQGLEAIIKEKEAENKSLDDEVEGCAEELEKLRKNLRSLREKNTSLQTALNLQEAANKTLEERIAEQQTEINKLQKVNHDLENDVLGAADEVRSLKEMHKSLKYKNVTAKKTIEDLRKNIDSLKSCKKCEELGNMITKLEKEKTEYASSCTSLGSTVEAHKTEIESLKSTIKKMEIHKKKEVANISHQVDIHIRHCLIYIDNIEKFIIQIRSTTTQCKLCIEFKDVCNSINVHIHSVKLKYLYANWISLASSIEDKAEEVVDTLMKEITAGCALKFNKNEDCMTQFYKLRREYIAKIHCFIVKLDDKLLKLSKMIKDRSEDSDSKIWSNGDNLEGFCCTCNMNASLCNILLNLEERFMLSLKVFDMADLDMVGSFNNYNKLIDTMDKKLVERYSEYDALCRTYNAENKEDVEAAKILKDTEVGVENYEHKYLISKELCRIRKIKLDELSSILQREGYSFKYLHSKKQTVIVKDSVPVNPTELHHPYAMAASISSRKAPLCPSEATAAPLQSTSDTVSSDDQLSRHLRKRRSVYRLSTDSGTTKKM